MANRRQRLKNKMKMRVLKTIPAFPTMLTLGNLTCGFVGILYSIKGYSLWLQAGNVFTPESIAAYQIAAWLVFGSMLFDLFDGRVARMTNSSSDFGIQIDSLADVVSFGLAPAILVKLLIAGQTIKHVDRLEWLVVILFVCFAALRLARYNVEADKTTAKDHFTGMPTPAAAGTISAIVIFFFDYFEPGQFEPYFQLILASAMLVLAVLMVSRVHYIHIGNKLLRGYKSFTHVAVLIFVVALFVYNLHLMLLCAFGIFVISGLINEVIAFFRKSPQHEEETMQEGSAIGHNPSEAAK